jgi:DNA polymerase-3 subunit gamma/tau
MSSQPYLVAARKYRPQLFQEIVAQEHVTETLTNAIRLDRLAHAYLFSGPRGVGKTTAARILAKAINCTTPLAERRDAGEPCRTCDSCRTFEEGRSLSIIEIDAASNNKVEDVRDLRETVLVPPQGSRRKVYIVDEVHMLSNAAFNALLKTLEEPPPYVLFIFATTEPNKVLPTILSRCQRFDFRRIGIPEIVAHLRRLCEAEGISADEGSLMLIAQKGDGALRDALSAFDQAVALCGSTLSYAELAQAFGVVDIDLYFEVTSAVATNDSAGMLRLVERIMHAGYDLQEFLGGLAAHLRHLLVARTMSDTSLIEAAEPIRERYASESDAFTEADLLRLLMLVDEGEEKLRGATQPRLRVELTLLKMAHTARSVDLREALAQIERWQRGNVPPPPPPVDPENTPPPSPPPSRAPLKLVEKSTPSPEAPSPEPPPADGLFGTPALRKPAGPRGSETEAALRLDVEVEVAPVPAPSGEAAVLPKDWPAFVHRIKAERIHVSALLQHAAPIEDRGDTIVLAVPDAFHQRMLENQHDFLIAHFREETGRPLTRFAFAIGEGAENPATAETPSEIDPYEYMQRKRQESPVIRALFDQFGGEMVW